MAQRTIRARHRGCTVNGFQLMAVALRLRYADKGFSGALG